MKYLFELKWYTPQKISAAKDVPVKTGYNAFFCYSFLV